MTTTASTNVNTPILNDGNLFWIILVLLVLGLIVIALPAWLSFLNRKQAESNDQNVNFFEIPYITWFLIHFGVPALAIIAILILGLDNVIDKSTISGLLGGLFGFVLGSASRAQSDKTDGAKDKK